MKTSVIGFTGDTSAPGLPGTYHAVHYHYLNGDNTPNNRLKLLTSRARVENFDGYSIRYAGEYLKRQKEEFKLLIVLSDGCPACRTYYSGKNGVLDTKLAVKEASKYCKVVGVLAGSSDPSKHQEMYGYNFLYIPTLSDLFNSLGAVIKKNIKDWS
jgi:nitric oxide reductase activation protein